MTEYFKQIVDAWGDRIRSPILGTILIVFVAMNWQSLFYLFFAEKPVMARLLYFNANTDNWSLYLGPALFGILFAVAVPWISFAGAWFARAPKSLLHALQFSEATRRRVAEFEKRAEEEDAIAKFEAAKENRQINAAKRFEEAGQVSKDAQDELKIERLKSDDKQDSGLSEFEANLRHDLENAFLLGLSESPEGLGACKDNAIHFAGGSASPIQLPKKRRSAITIEKTFENLVKRGLIEKTGKGPDDWQEFRITEEGYYYADELRKNKVVTQFSP
jgi:hypothetical protein